MDQEKREHFFSVLRSFGRAMLTTHSRDGGLHTRPMVVGDVDKDGNIWLLSASNSEKIEELSENRHANISMQADSQYATVAGDAELIHDKKRIEAIFQESWKAYFPQGAQDPNILLIKINAVHGEYWDNAGVSKVKYMYDVAKAYVTGTKAKHNAKTQGKVELNA